MGVVRSISQEYRPKEYEREILEFWERERIYEKIREESRGRPKFYFLDGPPYPSSDTPHIGTIWDKVLKDAVIRFRRARGHYVWDKPGYDCHGLPIEVKVEKILGFRSKKEIEEYGIDRFVEKCREFALRNVEGMTRHFRDFGVSMDWDNPYLTLKNEYIESAWWLVKKADEKGLLEKGVKVVHWCPRCETTLADYEVTEYRELEDPSIYVKLPLRDRPGHYLLVWTTTPWTLPANVAVMAHPELEYVWVEVGGERLLLARERLEEVMGEAGVEEYRVVGSVKGRELEGLRYVPPLLEEVPAQRRLEGAHRVVLSEEYVTAEEGTGLVHTAPGHGEEDFEVGQRYGLPVLSPVDDRGRYTEEAGKYAGMFVRDANPVIVEDLRRKGLLFHASTIRHRYPVCWRCKTPLILRATPQWYIRVTHLKERFLEEAQRVKWVPEWAGYSRFKNWLEGLRDWIISRQRYWGIPVPIWVCEKCGHRVVVGSLKELEELARRRLELPDLHRPWIDGVELKCPKCGGTMRRVRDVTDVWLDSGVAFYASLGYPGREEPFRSLWPVDFITEGHDQIAGWFFSQLRCGLITFDRAPYETVLMHGFALDERGREMHKSLGNYVAPQEVLAFERGSRDALRWFVLRNTIWEDLKFSWNGVAEAYGDLHLVWNVYYFATLYMGLDRFDPERHSLEELWGSLREEDRWMLSRVERLTRDVTRHMEEYEIHRAARALRDFIDRDVSRWYVKLVRPRVWVERDDPDKLAAYAVLHHVLTRFLVLAAPIVPFIAEKIYRDAFAGPGDPPSVHMLSWPVARGDWIDDELERDMEAVRDVVERGLAARMRAGVKVRQPLPALYVVTGDRGLARALGRLGHIVESQVNVKRVEAVPPERLGEFLAVRVKPVYRALGPVFRGRAREVAEALAGLDGAELRERLEEDGFYELEVGGERVRVEPGMVEFEEEFREGYVGVPLDGGYVVLDTRAGEEELAEGLARDVLRRIQFMRKKMGLDVEEYVEVTVYLPEEQARLLEPLLGYVAGEARARDIRIVGDPGEVAGDYVEEWDLGGITVRIGVRRLGSE